MISWYKDEELEVLFDDIPRPRIRYALPSDTDEEKKDIKKYPFSMAKDLQVVIVYDSKQYNFSVSKGYKWDGATIPRLLWRIIGSSTEPEFLIASCIHDVLCENHNYIDSDRNLSSKIFRGLLLEAGVCKFKANLMYAGVDTFQRFCGW